LATGPSTSHFNTSGIIRARQDAAIASSDAANSLSRTPRT
jgi:hypothetical protein